MYKGHMVVSVRQNGLRQLVVYDVAASGREFRIENERTIKFDEDAYALRGGGGEYKCVAVVLMEAILRCTAMVDDPLECLAEHALNLHFERIRVTFNSTWAECTVGDSRDLLLHGGWLWDRFNCFQSKSLNQSFVSISCRTVPALGTENVETPGAKMRAMLVQV